MPPSEYMFNTTYSECHVCLYFLKDVHENINSHLTGLFPIERYAGMNYIYICYVYKLDAVLLRTMKN